MSSTRRLLSLTLKPLKHSIDVWFKMMRPMVKSRRINIIGAGGDIEVVGAGDYAST
jgi:hypothetical protein